MATSRCCNRHPAVKCFLKAPLDSDQKKCIGKARVNPSSSCGKERQCNRRGTCTTSVLRAAPLLSYYLQLDGLLRVNGTQLSLLK